MSEAIASSRVLTKQIGFNVSYKLTKKLDFHKNYN
jgi:hypothetical protein